jgi:TetR/AcrR family transcriptional regulator, cholesterol catabolism regulator
VRPTMIPATPSTPAQRDRYQRMVQAATAMLASGGEDALQMKELAERAVVSLATLYRYFPSKDHLLLAISKSRYENALRRVMSEQPRGDTVQERVTSHLLREFRAEQRDQRLTAALVRVVTDTRPEYQPVIAEIHQLHMRVLEHVATAGGPVDAELRRRLLIVLDVFGTATGRWLAGVSSAAEARFEIRVGCYLLGDCGKEAAA